MCGILAAWDPAGLDDAPLAAARADLRHRGPDAQSSIWRDERRLHFAHTRLKIIDTSDAANQPFVSPCGRWALIFNGEIYNYRELRREIGDRWQWRTSSDTEVLMAAWSLWGCGALDRLVGMFAFALHDADAHRLTLARDRFGIKPMYYVAVGRRRVFASEIGPLLRFVPNIAADEATIRSYLELGLYDHGRYTFFAGVEAIEPGSLIDIDLRDGGERRRQWYVLHEHVADLSGLDASELLERTDVLVQQAIRSHLVADVAVGLNVSGGVDSSMLVRSTVEALGHAHLFTQDFENYSELPWVRAVADGGTLHVARLGVREIEGYLDQTTRSQGEPFGGVTICGYNALYEMARRENVVVLLDGHGADELFLGYKRYHQIHVASASSPAELERRRRDYEASWGEQPSQVRPGASMDGTYGLCPEALTPSLRREPLRPAPVVAEGFDAARQAAAADLLYGKIPRGMRFNDRVSMAHSRELRVPFLDHRLVEFAFGLPTDRLITGRGGKAMFRELLARRAPAALAYARKRSIQSPQREWLAGEWRPLVESLLASDSFAERGWVDPVKAQQAFQAYRTGTADNSFFVWQWVNLELWARSYLDGLRAAA